MKIHKHFFLTIILTALIFLTCSISYRLQPQTNRPLEFDEVQAMEDVRQQLSFGPRTIGSDAHEKEVAWLVSELQKLGWVVEIQRSERAGHIISNIIGRRGDGNPWIILGAHYDSRFVADKDTDPQLRSSPVPGANDGASGVAVLLGLARSLPLELDKQIWLVFFDAEDNGNYPGWDWILGSQAFMSTLKGQPEAVIIVDMVGDSDLNIYKEKNSDAELTEEIWTLAASLGYTQFIPEYKHRIIDDHLPFRNAGIPAIDIIDFDYPYWHTVSDTVDKISEESLNAVGNTLLHWLVP